MGKKMEKEVYTPLSPSHLNLNKCMLAAAWNRVLKHVPQKKFPHGNAAVPCLLSQATKLRPPVQGFRAFGFRVLEKGFKLCLKGLE